MGTTVFHEGDAGDRYHAVAAGSLAVSRGGVVVQTASRGEGFGEIALIREVPRRATVTAMTDASLYALQEDLFLQTVTGHPAASVAAGRIISDHLGGRTDPDEGEAPKSADG